MRTTGRFIVPLVLLAALAVAGNAPAATVTVVNLDGAGEGFNDATVVSPVGGNSATTLGAQRLAAFQAAADVWGAELDSAVTIRVGAQMDPLTCSASSAVLGQAGPTTVHRDFVGAPVANTYYPQALANKLAGSDLSVQDDISATFNSAIGTTCSFPNVWYYGLDGNPPGGQIDFVAVVLHEIGHGLGFLTFVNTSTGARLNNRDDTYMRNLEDHSTGLLWSAMSDAERLASAIDTNDLHWVGAAVVANSGILSAGRHASGHVEMYAPNPIQSGSSVSHFGTSCSPNELMEPIYTGPLHVTSLARHLMTDIGWGSGFASTTTTSSTTSTSSSTSTTSTSSTTTTSTSTTTSSTTSTSTTTTSSTSSSTSTTTSSTTSTTTSTSTTSTTSTSTSTSSTTSTSTTSTSTTSTTSTSTSTTSSTSTSVPTTSSTTTTSSSTSSTTSTSTTSTTSSTSTTTSTTVPTTSSSTSTSTTSTTSTSSTTSSTSSTSTTSSTTTSTSTTSSTTTSTTTTSSTTSSTSTTTSTSSTTTTSTSTSTSTSSTTSTSTSTSSSTTTLPGVADVCPPAPLAGCRSSASQHATLLLRDSTDDRKDALRWKLTRGANATRSAFGDPIGGSSAVRLCVYDASVSPQPLVVGAVPAGGTCGTKPCWRGLGSSGYRYKDRAGSSAGVTDLKLRTSASGEAQMVAKAKGLKLPMPGLGLTLPVTVQLVTGDGTAAECWESTFESATKNDATQFRATSP